MMIAIYPRPGNPLQSAGIKVEGEQIRADGE
jgi:hypothetical protein